MKKKVLKKVSPRYSTKTFYFLFPKIAGLFSFYQGRVELFLVQGKGFQKDDK